MIESFSLRFAEEVGCEVVFSVDDDGVDTIGFVLTVPSRSDAESTMTNGAAW